MDDREKTVTASIAGGGTFLFFLLVMNTFLPISLALGLGVTAGVKYLTPGKKVKLPVGINHNDYKKAISKGKQILEELKEAKKTIQDSDVRYGIDDVISISRKIIKNIEEYPEDYRPAKKFFSYYLPTTLKLTEKYIPLQDDEDFGYKVNHALELVDENFKKLYKRLQDNDKLEIDTELKVLKQIMESDI